MNAAAETKSSVDVPTLADALAAVRARIEARLGRGPDARDGAAERDAPASDTSEPAAPAASGSPASASAPSFSGGGAPGDHPLAVLLKRFSLSAFERDVLVLCAGVELDASFAALVVEAQRAAGGPPAPTFGFALAVFGDAHWSALSPEGALRRWRLVEFAADSGVTTAPLRIDERVLHFLTGVVYFEPRLAGTIEPFGGVSELAPSQVPIARAALDAWSDATPLAHTPVLILTGGPVEGHESLAGTLAGTLGLRLLRLRAAALPGSGPERVALARLWEREAMLMRGALYVALGEDDGEEVRERARSFVEELLGLSFVSTPARFALRRRPSLAVELPRPGPADQLQIWRRELGAAAAGLNGAVERVAAQFQLDPPAIRRAARRLAAAEAGGEPAAALWAACRGEARAALDGLAQSIEPRASWADLVLPEAQLQVLRTMVAQVRQRAKVGEAWGFARKSQRGLGIHALFAGPSGTGKTLAAEVVAQELALDLHRIDLSALVSKYIGETEKNLRRVFDAAERGGSILLFDEADALFGRRSEVKDSHDRYANIEVSYLLQRIESYRGLAILTTNLKGALDPAFARRLRFTVHFAFPDQALRAEIWRRIFPAETPLDGVDCDKLARLSLSGGHIRNVALNAAYLAADAGEPVRMRHLLAAAQTEYAKLEKPLTPAETAGWL